LLIIVVRLVQTRHSVSREVWSSSWETPSFLTTRTSSSTSLPSCQIHTTRRKPRPKSRSSTSLYHQGDVELARSLTEAGDFIAPRS